ncbi:MAG: aminoacyl-tRNA hydrolase [Patescibacteria group bacterium]
MKKLIIGLGNPGKKYEKTRHNIGFRVVDALVQSSERSPLKENKALHCILSENPDIILAKPTTYMNESGAALESLIDYFKLDRAQPDNFLIIHDDLDIPFSQLKIQRGHSAAGHKGALSTMEVLPKDSFWRMRIGIAGKTKDTMPGEAYVLSPFTTEERAELVPIIGRAVQAVDAFLNHSPETAAQTYNQKQQKEVY